VAFVPVFWERFAVNWDAIRAQFRTTFQVVRDEPNMFAVQIPMKAEGSEITQDLGMAIHEARQRKLLALLAPIAPAQRLDPTTILQYQDRLPFGAVVIRGESILLRHDVLVETLTPTVLSWIAAVVAFEAAKLRVNLRVPETNTFSHYTED
jgi:hypothetical protein